MGVFIAIGSAVILGVAIFALYGSMSKAAVRSMNESVGEMTSAIRDAAQGAEMSEADAQSVNGSAEGVTGMDDDPKKDKETICHIPPGKPKKAKTMKVKQDDVPAHLGHGDYLGPCR